jgi:nitrite reductase/ring-hydroxylating ferredoxin subunit
MSMTCDWCSDDGLFPTHDWVLCARHWAQHVTAHQCLVSEAELEKEMLLVRHLLAHIHAAAAGDPVADRHVVLDSLALCRWHGWTPDSVVDFLTLMVVGVRS